MRSVVVLTEHTERELFLEDSDARFLLSTFPKVLEIRPTARAGRWTLNPGAYVGSIVTPGLELRLRPKIPFENLFGMLGHAFGLARIRREIVRQSLTNDVQPFLVAILVELLEELIRRGTRRGYIEHQARLSALRGRLLLGEHLRSQVTGAIGLVCRFEDYTADLPANQIVRFTLRQIGSLGDAALDRRLRKVRAAFAHVSHRQFRDADFDQFSYDRLNADYEPIHGLCRLILDARGASNAAGAYPMGSFLVNMNQLFERFVSSWLEMSLRGPWRLAAQRKTMLDQRGHVVMYPDLVLLYRDVPVLVADTKYKLAGGVVGNPDAYQALAYCRALAVRRAVLVYPDVSGRSQRLTIVDGSNEIVADGIDLRAPWADLEVAMNALVGRLTDAAASVDPSDRAGGRIAS